MDVTVAQFASEVNDVSGFLKPGKKRSLNQITKPEPPIRANQRLKKEPQVQPSPTALPRSAINKSAFAIRKDRKNVSFEEPRRFSRQDPTTIPK